MARVFILLIGIVFLVIGCYPDSGTNSLDELDSVVTLYDSTVKFNSMKTFFLADSVLHFTSDGADSISRDYDELILSSLNENLLKRGFSRKNKPLSSPPDLVVFVTVLAAKHSGSIWKPGWWYDWAWNEWLHFPWDEDSVPSMSGYEVPYSYSTGTIIVYMIDTSQSSIDFERLQVVWNASINGVLAQKETNTAQRIQSLVDQAFDQSPYLISSL